MVECGSVVVFGRSLVCVCVCVCVCVSVCVCVTIRPVLVQFCSVQTLWLLLATTIPDGYGMVWYGTITPKWGVYVIAKSASKL